ncbi:MAG: hypothetical protein GXP62_02695 [Oligoflexia bacterium]|nr:hypothetical protein [Oligoflexia bacterium]
MHRFIAIPLKLFSASKIATFGVVVTTSGFLLELAVLWWTRQSGFDNPYLGIFTWNLIPGMIGTGLVIIPAGLLLAARKISGGKLNMAAIRGAATQVDWSVARHTATVVGVLTLVNGTFFTAAGYEGYHYMDEPEFCGLICHNVMEPEYTVYQRSPHSGVACVACHIGPGVSPFVKAKLNGTRQMVGVFTGHYSRPIETPVKLLRRAEEICLECHDPSTYQGEKLKVFKHYQEDQTNSIRYNILNLRIGGGSDLGFPSDGIHSHMQAGRHVSYKALDEEWNQVVEVTRTDASGDSKTWRRIDWTEDAQHKIKTEREMDCIDCHNRVGHDFLSADAAVDERLEVGAINVNIPWIKAEAMKVIRPRYATDEEAHKAIAGLAQVYQTQHPEAWETYQEDIEQSIEVLQDTWSEFVWPGMNLYWGTYQSRHTHQDTETGCFRCHTEQMVDDKGEPLTSGCEACHFVLAEDDPMPNAFKILHRKREVSIF